MATYYEILGVDPSASTAEILEKYDEKFDEWRQLITNHNPDVAEEANHNIRLLEKIRNTLMDEKARKTYDDLLIAGGLKDPDAEVQNSYNIPMGPANKTNYRRQATKDPYERTDAWICPNKKCGHVNAVGEQHCTKCGTRIGARCPKCGELVELSKTFCSKCGVDKGKYFEGLKIKKIEELNKNQKKFQTDIDKYSNMLLSGNVSMNELKEDGLNPPIESGAGIVAFIVLILLFSCLATTFAVNTDSSGAVIYFVAIIVLMGWGLISTINGKKKDAKKFLENHVNYLKELLSDIKKNIKLIEDSKYGDEIDLNVDININD